MKKSYIFKGIGILAVFIVVALLFKFVPFKGILNIGTWVLVFMITFFAVWSLWKDIDILDDNASSLRTTYEKLFSQNNVEKTSEGEGKQQDVIVIWNKLSLEDITMALQGTPLYNQWKTLVTNKVNTYIINNDIYLKEDIHQTLKVSNLFAQLDRHLWRQQMPQLLTGAGILGTFLGLTIGLYRLNIFSNGSELIHQMGALISSSGTAFFTSLVGIGFSLFYVITLIEFTKDLKREYGKLIDALHLVVLYKSEGEYLGDIIRGNAQSSAQLVTHVQGIEDAFVQSMDKIVKGVGRTVGKMVSKEVQDLQDKVNSLNQTVANMTAQTQDFSAAIRLYNDTMQNQNKEIVTFTESIKTEVKNLSSSNVDATKNLLGTFEQYMVNTSNTLEVMGKMQEVFNSNLKNMHQSFNSNLGDIHQAFKEEINNANNNYIGQLSKQGDQLQGVIISSIETLENAEKEFLKIKEEYLDSYVKSSKHLEEKLKSQLDEQANLNLKLIDVYSDYNNLKDELLKEITSEKFSKAKTVNITAVANNSDIDNKETGNIDYKNIVVNQLVNTDVKSSDDRKQYDVEDEKLYKQDEVNELSFHEVSNISADAYAALMSDRADVAIETSIEYKEVTSSSAESDVISEQSVEEIVSKKEAPKMATYEESNLY